GSTSTIPARFQRRSVSITLTSISAQTTAPPFALRSTGARRAIGKAATTPSQSRDSVLIAMRDICLKVLSWNLHGLAWPLSKDPGGRMDRVSAKVRELSPDVALL